LIDLHPLRIPAFRRLAAANLVNGLGNWLGQIALAVLVYDRTHSPLATAALFLAMQIAPGLLSPLVVAHLERFPPRALLPLLYLGEAAAFAGLALLVGRFSLAPLLLLAGLDGILGVSARALSRSSSAALLGPRGLLREGNALMNMGFSAYGAAGPALAALVVGTGGVRAALWLDAGTFAAAAGVLSTTRGLRLEPNAGLSPLARLRAGARELRIRPPVARLLSAFAAAILFAALVVPIEVVFALRTLHAGSAGYSAMLASWGVGMVIGSVAFAAARRASLPLVLALSAGSIVAGYAGLAAAPSLALACIASAVGGIGNGAGIVATITAVQHAIPARAHPVVMAVIESLAQIMPAIGYVLGGAITALSSPRVAYAVAAAGIALAVLLLARRSIGELGLDSGAVASPSPPDVRLTEVPLRASAGSADEQATPDE
jgi:MFS family permease